jgi:hypothetical protein
MPLIVAPDGDLHSGWPRRPRKYAPHRPDCPLTLLPQPVSEERPEDQERTRTPFGTSRQIGSGFYLVSSYVRIRPLVGVIGR